jgi:hypothetical protein
VQLPLISSLLYGMRFATNCKVQFCQLLMKNIGCVWSSWITSFTN